MKTIHCYILVIENKLCSYKEVSEIVYEAEYGPTVPHPTSLIKSQWRYPQEEHRKFLLLSQVYLTLFTLKFSRIL